MGSDWKVHMMPKRLTKRLLAVAESTSRKVSGGHQIWGMKQQSMRFGLCGGQTAARIVEAGFQLVEQFQIISCFMNC